jgi:hypothetical protein
MAAVSLCTCAYPAITASAVPQFGRPMLHVLDAATTSPGLVEAVPTSPAASTGTGPDPDPQVIEATSSSFVCVYHCVL